MEVADAALDEKRAGDLKHELGQRLTQAKVSMQRGLEEDIVQDVATVVVALSKFVLGRKPGAEPSPKREHLRAALRDLEKRYEAQREITEAALHPTGRCTCAGEGTCEWCRTHCVHCGATEEQHTPTGDHRFESHTLSCPKCGCTDIDTRMGICIECAYRFSYAELPPRLPQAPEPEPEYELQPGGELREKEPVVEDKVDIGLDRKRWKVLTDMAGYPAVALYFNSGKDSLSVEQVEEIEAALVPILEKWGR
jgi:hypothetical protein